MSVLKITKCDNEMIAVATIWSDSYQIFDIKSGNGNNVDVTINLVQGEYDGPVKLNGVNSPLSGTYTVKIPQAEVNIGLLGINWGAAADFEVSLDGRTPYKYSSNNGKAFVVGLGDPLDDNTTGLSEVEIPSR